MSLSRTLPLVLTLGLLLAACGQQATNTGSVAATPSASAPTSAQAQTNAALDTFARQLAVSLTEPGVRSLIAQQTALAFDGDTEALYSTLASQSTGKGTFAQTLSSGLGAQSLNALSAQIPKLNIAVHGGKWDSARVTPWVAVAPEGGDEFAPVVAYDAQGQAHQLDSRKAPEMPVVVVGINERVDDTGALLPESLPVPVQKTGTLTAQGCYSVKLVRLDLYDDKEPWTRGKAEIYVAVSGPGIGWRGHMRMITAPGDYLDAIQGFGCTDGDVRFYWYEADGGSENHAISVGPWSFGISNDSSDDFLGSITMDKSLFEGTSVNARNLGDLKQYTH
ncbi:DUF3103 domain-containing protein [Deinococcus saxicola]|uniref:DUF3103 family protein n=1 Tax=Deinococcus saxicola TaxID=249406 RepID=UPI0039EF6EFF